MGSPVNRAAAGVRAAIVGTGTPTEAMENLSMAGRRVGTARSPQLGQTLANTQPRAAVSPANRPVDNLAPVQEPNANIVPPLGGARGFVNSNAGIIGYSPMMRVGGSARMNGGGQVTVNGGISGRGNSISSNVYNNYGVHITAGQVDPIQQELAERQLDDLRQSQSQKNSISGRFASGQKKGAALGKGIIQAITGSHSEQLMERQRGKGVL